MKIIKCLIVVVIVVNGIGCNDEKTSHDIESSSVPRVSNSAEISQENYKTTKSGIPSESAQDVTNERIGGNSTEKNSRISSDKTTTENPTTLKSSEQNTSKTGANSTENAEKIAHETKSEDKAKVIHVKEKMLRHGSDEDYSAEIETNEKRKGNGDSEETMKSNDPAKAPTQMRKSVSESEASSKQNKDTRSSNNNKKQEKPEKSDTEGRMKEQSKPNPVVADPLSPSRRMLKSNSKVADTSSGFVEAESTEDSKSDETVSKFRQPSYPYAGSRDTSNEHESETRSGHSSEVSTYSTDSRSGYPIDMPTYTRPGPPLPSPSFYSNQPFKASHSMTSTLSPALQMDFKTVDIPKPKSREFSTPKQSLKSNQMKSSNPLKPSLYPTDRRAYQMEPLKYFGIRSQEASMEPQFSFESQLPFTQLPSPLLRMESFQGFQPMQASEMRFMDSLREIEPPKRTDYQRSMGNLRLGMLPSVSTLAPLQMQLPQMTTLRSGFMPSMNGFRSLQNNINTAYTRLESSRPASQFNRWNTYTYSS